MWVLLAYLLGRRRRPARQTDPGASLVVFAMAFAGVLLGGMWLGVALAVAGVFLIALTM